MCESGPLLIIQREIIDGQVPEVHQSKIQLENDPSLTIKH